MFLQCFSIFCLVLSGARLGTAAHGLNARQDSSFATMPASRTLLWCPCLGANFSCALLDVPLDYANPTGRRAHVPFLKYSASTTPPKGTILLNPGGPGDSGVNSLLQQAEFFANAVLTDYDFVSFDPRGIGSSIPLANCSASVASSTAPPKRRFVDQLHGPHFNAQYFSDFYQSSQDLGKQCQATIGGPNAAGPHMSSAVVARDMISFLDAYANSTYSHGVRDPSLLNFWGFSYGSYLGQVFANMFPNRVGRVVLDSVVDAAANLAGDELNPAYADEAFSTFFVYCSLAGSSLCPYYIGTTANDILARFEVTITKLDPKIAKLRGWANATVIELTLEAIKSYSANAAYYPIELAPPPYPSFPALAQFLLDVEAAVHNLTMETYIQLATNYGINAPGDPPEWATGVQCTDNGNILNGRPLSSLVPEILFDEAQSYMNGEYISNLAVRCAGWPIVGKGVYPGPFGGATKNPILFVSNKRDPVLPIQNGQKAASIYHGAQLLTVDGTGHTPPSLLNNCSFGTIRTFFQTGALPGKNNFNYSKNFCPLEAGPWGVMANPAQLKKRNLDAITSRLKGLGHFM